MIGWLLSSSLLLLSSGGQRRVSQGSGASPCLEEVGTAVTAGQGDCFSGSSHQEKGEPADRFRLKGLLSPARVTASIFVDAPGLPRRASVTYFLDDQALAVTHEFPYKLGQGEGYSLDYVAPGTHRLRGEAKLSNGETLLSNTITLDVLPSINHRFSAGLSAYANQPTAQAKSMEEILHQTSTPGAELTSAEVAVRENALSMYMNWGIDPSLDSQNDQSEMLLSLNPQGWAGGHQRGVNDFLSLRFSSDAPFYQAIPRRWPRVSLPSGYFKHVQVNTVQAGDGIGFGESVAEPNDVEQPIHSQWYSDVATSKTFPFRMSPRWVQHMPWQPGGDHHMIFIDPDTETFVSSYMTSKNESTGGVEALFASSPTKLGTLGDKGGSIAAGFAELPTMLQPGEATNTKEPIRHALGGAVARTWAARVYPANARDASVLTSTNTCTGKASPIRGLCPMAE